MSDGVSWTAFGQNSMNYSFFLGKLQGYGAEGGTRTPTSYLTRPSNVRVYQFRHFGSGLGRMSKISVADRSKS
jgi:hypothetical protein